MIEKKDTDPYELILGAIDAPHGDVVQEPQEVFDEAAARREIAELTRKMSEEKKNNGNSVLADKYQREIVVLRQRIIDHEMKRTK